MARPQNKTLINTIDYLASIGLHLYGNNVDLKTGQTYPSLRDYDSSAAVEYRKMLENDEINEVVGYD